MGWTSSTRSVLKRKLENKLGQVNPINPIEIDIIFCSILIAIDFSFYFSFLFNSLIIVTLVRRGFHLICFLYLHVVLMQQLSRIFDSDY